MANLEATINAVCAVRILLEAQFGPGIEELLPPVGLGDVVITRRPDWSAVELYFPPAQGAPLQPIPALG